MTHEWLKGNCLAVVPEYDGEYDLVIADPPYENLKLISESIAVCRNHFDGPSFFFMYPESVWDLEAQPDQILHWIKPPSTKNTTRKYSRFVEAIAVYDLDTSPFNQDTFWHSRSGVFTDTPLRVKHPHTKPESLIEKLIAVNSNQGDTVLDPFAGSGTVAKVCKRMGRGSISIEKGN